MMHSAAAFAGICLLLGGCATANLSALPVMTSQQVWDQHHELDGKMIKVTGWLQYCGFLGCRIADHPEDRKPGLSIGSSESFDRDVERLVGKRIVVAGKLDADCLHVSVEGYDPDKGGIVCTDRANEIDNPRLVSVH